MNLPFPRLEIPSSRASTAEPRAIQGRVLRADLNAMRLSVDEPDEAWYRCYIGGRGVVGYYLLSELVRGADPLGPENLLIFAPGVLNGLALPGTGRHGVGAKSPLTGGFGSSEAGGWWGTEFKRAGFDALVISGRAASPVYLWIHHGVAEIRAADHLWGRTTGYVQAEIRRELGDPQVRVAQTGIAGENGVRYACVIHDANRAAGRTGLGAVMGAKNLKAVAVRGTAIGLGAADRRGLAQTARWLGANYQKLAAWAVLVGTVGGVHFLNEVSGLPTRNFRDPQFEQADAISGESLYASMLKGRDTCWGCPIRCKQVVEAKNGAYRVESVYGGPEYETLAAFGSDCGIGDLTAVVKANELAAAYGLDTISTGATIAFVMECFEEGLLTPSDAGGWSIRFGDAAGMVDAVGMIAHRRGFGADMAEGSARLAARIGGRAPELAMHVHGQEIPMHEPRFKPGTGMGYTVSPTGADHMHNIHDSDYTFEGNDLERARAAGVPGPVELGDLGPRKIDLFYHETNWRHFLDCACVCMFYPYHYEHLAAALHAATGWDVDIHEILEIGKRAATMGRLFSLREGWSPRADRLPARFYSAFREGPLAEERLGEDAIEEARQLYFERMGWDDAGRPTHEALARLGLEWAWERLV